MKYLIIIAVALVAVVSPVNAKLPPRCTGSCHFFRAWALTKLCPNISFNEAGREAVEFFVHSSEAREILRQETIGVKKNVDISYGRDAEIIERPRCGLSGGCPSGPNRGS